MSTYKFNIIEFGINMKNQSAIPLISEDKCFFFKSDWVLNFIIYCNNGEIKSTLIETKEKILKRKEI